MENETLNSLTFSVAVTVASWALILRDRLLGRVNGVRWEGQSYPRISRLMIASGKQHLDAVFVTPTNVPVQAAVLLCHGIGETVDHWRAVQNLLAAQGVASLVFDYAGYGRSTGQIGWKQCEEDTIAAFSVLKTLLPESPCSILGFSLGSGIAAAVLDRVSPTHLILCSSFTSFQAAARRAGLPHRLSFLAPPIWNTEELLRRCSVPVLVLHCEKDRLFPAQMALDLASNLKERVQVAIVSNHQHNTPFRRPERRYWDHVIYFLLSNP